MKKKRKKNYFLSEKKTRCFLRWDDESAQEAKFFVFLFVWRSPLSVFSSYFCLFVLGGGVVKNNLELGGWI